MSEWRVGDRVVVQDHSEAHGASNTPEMRLFWDAKKRAKRRGISFTITPVHVVIPAKCPLLGVPLQAAQRVQSPNSPSLDRVDPIRGYDPGNVWVISYRANAIKSDATLDELKRLVAALEAKCGI
jgi:hypothetical protein